MGIRISDHGLNIGDTSDWLALLSYRVGLDTRVCTDDDYQHLEGFLANSHGAEKLKFWVFSQQ